MSSPVRMYWAKMNPIFHDMRARMGGNEEVIEYTEYLFNEVEKRRNQMGAPKVIDPYKTELAT